MKYLASTYDTKRQTKKGLPSASHAANVRTYPSYNAGTSNLGGTQLLGTKLTMSHANALPAIFSEAENNTFLGDILKCKSQDALKNLCNKRSEVESTRLMSYELYMSITGKEVNTMHKPRKSTLNAEQRKQYDELREQRLELMTEMKEKGMSMRKGRYMRFKCVNHLLYSLTRHHGYNFK